MIDREPVLFANEAFYRAFADRDYDALDALWSDHAPCSCLHPGWEPIFGRENVMESWAAIIANPESPGVVCHQPEVTIIDNTAIVVCYEEIAGQFLVATNVFVREGSIWKIVHHQAGPTTGVPDIGGEEDGEAPLH